MVGRVMPWLVVLAIGVAIAVLAVWDSGADPSGPGEPRAARQTPAPSPEPGSQRASRSSRSSMSGVQAHSLARYLAVGSRDVPGFLPQWVRGASDVYAPTSLDRCSPHAPSAAYRLAVLRRSFVDGTGRPALRHEVVVYENGYAALAVEELVASPRCNPLQPLRSPRGVATVRTTGSGTGPRTGPGNGAVLVVQRRADVVSVLRVSPSYAALSSRLVRTIATQLTGPLPGMMETVEASSVG